MSIEPGTPLPWRYIAGDVQSGDLPRRGKIASLSISHKSSAERDANASYIIHACNTYLATQATIDELVRALETTLALALLKWGNLDPDANKVFDAAKSTLAKARGAA